MRRERFAIVFQSAGIVREIHIHDPDIAGNSRRAAFVSEGFMRRERFAIVFQSAGIVREIFIDNPDIAGNSRRAAFVAEGFIERQCLPEICFGGGVSAGIVCYNSQRMQRLCFFLVISGGAGEG
jgi:hypothetical protein